MLFTLYRKGCTVDRLLRTAIVVPSLHLHVSTLGRNLRVHPAGNVHLRTIVRFASRAFSAKSNGRIPFELAEAGNCCGLTSF